jgi:hypothetical protein
VLQPSALPSFAAHSLRFSGGKTALKLAIDCSKSDVAAYLRSIGARE